MIKQKVQVTTQIEILVLVQMSLRISKFNRFDQVTIPGYKGLYNSQQSL